MNTYPQSQTEDTREPASIGSSGQEVSPELPRWGLLAGILFWLLSVILIAVVPLLFLIPYIGPDRPPGSKQFQQTVLSDPTAVLIALAGTFGAHVITFLVGWAIVTRGGKFPFLRSLGWKWGGFKFWHGALMFVGVYIFAAVMSSLLGTHENEMQRILDSSRSAVFAVALIATFSAPLIEEVVYRGVLYSAFEKKLGMPVAFASVTVIFAVVHVAQYYPDIATISSIVVLSLLLTGIRAYSKNLLPCVAFHFVFNGFQSLLLVLRPYLPVNLDPTSPSSFFFHLLK